MPSTLKDSSPFNHRTGVVSGNPPSAASAEASSNRTQPVALEVEIAVNGVRAVEGSDKREPFSETTKTVLVFSNGAVMRLSTPPAPGQLLFLRNERTKKEVVCQVVKSKNYRNVSGYVEVEFTEPAVGFWGMRFPGDRIGPTPAPAPVAKAPAPIAPPTPSTLPAQSVQRIVAPNAEPPGQVLAPTHAAIPALPEPAAAKQVELQIVKPETAAPSSPELSASILEPSAPSKKWEPETESLEEIKQHTARLQEQLSSLLFSNSEDSKSEANSPAASAAISSENQNISARSDSISQLASDLFDLSNSSAKQNPSETSKSFSELASKVLEFSKAEPAAPVETSARQDNSPATPTSFDEESIKIPSWLEPLARNTVAPASTQELIERQKTKAAEKQTLAPPPAKAKEPSLPPIEELPAEEFEPAEFDRTSAKLPIPSFGSALPIDEKRLPVPSFGSTLLIDEKPENAKVPGRSGKGILIGAFAAVLCVAAAGGFWYWKQQARPVPSTAAAQAATPAPPATGGSSQTAVPVTAAPSNPVALANSANAVARPSASTPAEASTPEVRPASEDVKAIEPVGVKSASSKMMQTPPAAAQTRAAARPNIEPQPQLARPSLGAVHLAAPKVHRSSASADNASSDSAPTLAGTDSIPNADSMSGGLTGASARGPAAPTTPIPIGGDVKQATLLSSVPPVYPSLARSQHLGGDVKIDALIDQQGRVSAMTVISGPTLLRQAAMDALRQWKYQPATLDGNPVPMHLTVTIQFHLQ